jgi:hypothetical protein
LYFILDDEHHHWVKYAIFIKCPVSKPIQTPIEMKDPVSKEPWTTKDAPTFKSGKVCNKITSQSFHSYLKSTDKLNH